MKLSKSLIGFLPAGYPSMKASRELLMALGSEVDVLEVGIPFSDPIADGKVIQAASYAAIRGGANVENCLALIKEVKRETGKPIAVLTYYNIPYSYGMDRFMAAASGSIDAILLADLNIDDSQEFEGSCGSHGIGTVFTVAPNTPEPRLAEIDRHATGFIYMLSHFSVTGAKTDLQQLTLDTVRRFKPIAKNPIAVGFGISSRQHVEALFKAGADAAVVGSAFVKAIDPQSTDKSKSALKKLARELKG